MSDFHDFYGFWENLMNNWQMNLLVFARMIGIFSFNPVFSRTNLPMRFKVGTTIAISIFLVTVMPPELHVEFQSLGLFGMAAVFEGFVGFVLGFLTQMFLGAILVAGDVIDMQSGLGMAKIYDPSMGAQMPLFGSLATYLFLLYFFSTNCHMLYIRIFWMSYDIIPLGLQTFNGDLGWVIVEYFGVILSLALRMAMPIIAAQLILEFAMGILMKAVPSIQVMVVNMQMKLMFTLILTFLLAPAFADYINEYIDVLFQSLQNVVSLIIPA